MAAVAMLHEDGSAFNQEDGTAAYLNLPALSLSLSPYIAGGGEATTARMTPPSGKTTANFTAGKIADDTNPLPSVDVANTNYTEDAWSVAAEADAVAVGETYEFRVILSDGSTLVYYTVTPQLVIGASYPLPYLERAPLRGLSRGLMRGAAR